VRSTSSAASRCRCAAASTASSSCCSFSAAAVSPSDLALASPPFPGVAAPAVLPASAVARWAMRSMSAQRAADDGRSWTRVRSGSLRTAPGPGGSTASTTTPTFPSNHPAACEDPSVEASAGAMRPRSRHARVGVADGPYGSVSAGAARAPSTPPSACCCC
jgi:hypothetical protein